MAGHGGIEASPPTPPSRLTSEECQLARSGTVEEQRRVLRRVAQGRAAAESDLLIQCLGSEDWEARSLAAWVLRDFHQPEVVTALLPLLRDPDHHVRAMAAQTLGDLGGTASIPALKAGLKDAHPEVRHHVLWALLALQAPFEREDLTPLLKDPEPVIRAAAILGLKGRTESYVPEVLLAALGDDSDRVRRAAILTLRPFFTPELIVRIRTFIADPSTKVRISAIIALGEARDAGSVPLLLETYGKEGTFVRPSILIALGRIADPSAVPLLRLALDEPSPPLVVCALWGLGELEVREVRSQVARLCTSKVRTIRAASLEALGRLGAPEDVELLLSSLHDRDPYIRRGACLGLGHLANPLSVPEIQGMLDDPEAEVQLCAIWALGRVYDPSSIPLLLLRLRKETGLAKGEILKTPEEEEAGSPPSVLAGEKAVTIVSDAPELMLDTLLLSLQRLLRELPDRESYLREAREALASLSLPLRAVPARLPQSEKRRRDKSLTRERLIQELLEIGSAP